MRFIDQLKQEVELPQYPQRIVSLVPSQTELLFDLGLDERVVGITKFCIHPNKWFKSKKRVGGTKQIKLDVIQELNPDLIIANKEENTQEDIEELKNEYPVWVSDVFNLEDSIEMIHSIGEITATLDRAEYLIEQIQLEFSKLNLPNKGSCLYLIWKKPYMSIGRDTFIHAMLKKAGFSNIIDEKDLGDQRYPELTINEIRDLNPDHILLSSEPYPFKEKDKGELKEFCQTARITKVDGEMFSWYGSRLQLASSYFSELHKALS